MVHIAGKRYRFRPEKVTTVKVYTNCHEVTLYADGKCIGTKSGGHVLTFRVPIGESTKIEAVSGILHDEVTLCYVTRKNPDYKLRKKSSGNWM